MRRVFEALGELFGCLIAMDDVLQRATRLPPSLAAYRRIIKNMRSEPSRYGSTEAQLSALDARLGEVDDALFSGLIFSRAIRQPFDVPGELSVGSNPQFMGELLDAIKHSLAYLSKAIGESTETTQRDQLVGIISLFCFHQFLGVQAKERPVDKKLYKELWGLIKRVPLLPLAGSATWRPRSTSPASSRSSSAPT